MIYQNKYIIFSYIIYLYNIYKYFIIFRCYLWSLSVCPHVFLVFFFNVSLFFPPCFTLIVPRLVSIVFSFASRGSLVGFCSTVFPGCLHSVSPCSLLTYSLMLGAVLCVS